MSPSVLIVFRNFKLICSYFVLVAIIIFDLALHLCIFIIYAEYFWLVMAGLKEKNYTLILKFVYITFCLTTNHCHFNHRLCCSWRFWLYRPHFIVKFLLNLCILFIHCSFFCQVSIDLIHFSPLNFFWVLASSLVIILKSFLIFR